MVMPKLGLYVYSKILLRVWYWRVGRTGADIIKVQGLSGSKLFQRSLRMNILMLGTESDKCSGGTIDVVLKMFKA